MDAYEYMQGGCGWGDIWKWLNNRETRDNAEPLGDWWGSKPFPLSLLSWEQRLARKNALCISRSQKCGTGSKVWMKGKTWREIAELEKQGFESR